MSASVLNSRAVMIVAGVLAAGAVLYFFGRQVTRAASSAVKAVSNVNQGTPYEGTGVLGTLGHATDAASGGLLSQFGGWLGRKVFDLTHEEYDPNAPAVGSTFKD